ncbi:MAG: TerC/Alx family metal homeostasis membrane protein [Nocardioides sp.]
MQIPVWFEVGSMVTITLILVADIYLAFKRPHIPTTRECALWISFYIGLALVFAAALWAIGDAKHAGEFVAGWLTEYSLSVDNLFVFLLIMARFKVPRHNQQELLMIGIVLALIFRGVFILLGAALIEQFSWIFYIFGAFLLYTAIRQVTGEEDSDVEETSRAIMWIRSRLNITDEFHGAKLRVTVDGVKVFTPVILVVIALGTTDVIFALDSIPAIFGITQVAFLVFAANVFALMGLRQLYFLLGDLVERLIYLKYGIAAILAFIGVKLFLHAMHENELSFINDGQHIDWAPEIPIWFSLVFIVVAMAVAVIASLATIAKQPAHSLPSDKD